MAKERKSPEQKLAELQEKQRQIAERIKTENARIASQKRKEDTRRKILAGSVALNHADHDPKFGADLKAQIDKNVTRDDDRALFGLAPLKGENRKE